MWLKWFQGPHREVPSPELPLHLYNTMSRTKELFSASGPVKMYNCGPTVYGRQHIGNVSMYVFTDILRRALEYKGYTVKQVINITDVGHLTSDGDEGEDKMTKGLRSEGLELTLENMRALADKYTAYFLDDLRALNIDTKGIEFPRASDYIPAQIAMIQTLEEKGYAYAGAQGVYYDTSLFPEYGRLGNIDIEGIREGARVAVSDDKRNPTDFLLWKFSSSSTPSKIPTHGKKSAVSESLGWDSPWGKGFPGWHIECSAMIRRTLGPQIDIHTGGIEHIPIHHNNEIAQSEIATGKRPLSRYWMHRAHIQIEGGKIAKSDGTVIYLSHITQRGIHPLALRYLFLGAHYRTNMNFSWQSLEAAEKAYGRIVAAGQEITDSPTLPPAIWMKTFLERIYDDLDTPGALAILWEMMQDDSVQPAERRAMLIEADSVLGLKITTPDDSGKELSRRFSKNVVDTAELPENVADLLMRREAARTIQNWSLADTLRD